MLLPIAHNELQKLRRHLPLAIAHILPDGQIKLVRHPKVLPEQIRDSRTLFSAAAKISTGWERINQIATANHATISTLRQDFYGPATLLKYQCTHADCQYEWSATYEQMNTALRRIANGYSCVDVPRKLAASKKYHDRWFCPQCRQKISDEYNGESKKARFAMMTDTELLDAAREAPKTNGMKQNEFINDNRPLYTEMRSRSAEKGRISRNLFDQFSREHSWRTVRPELKDMTFEDWCVFLDEKNYNRIESWKKDDPRSLVVCSKEDFYPEIRKRYFTKPLMLFNGVIYQSVAEVVVAKVLHYCDIEFTAHRAWPFTLHDSTRRLIRDFDFQLFNQHYSIEVWMATEDELQGNEKKDLYLRDYIDRQNYKIRQVAACEPETHLIGISARKLRLEGIEVYLEHILTQLDRVGITAPSITGEDIGFTTTDIEVWSTQVWLEECVRHGWKQLTNMPEKFQNFLRNNKKEGDNLQLSLAKALAEHYSYPLNTRYYAAPKQTVIDYVDSRPELWERKAYEKIHKAGKLPHGFPQRPDATYQLTGWSALYGVHEFVNYWTAKAIVQRFEFQSRDEFHRARTSTDPQYRLLRTILGCAGNQKHGGYKEFEGWPTFLGYKNKTPWCQTIEGEKTIILLKQGSVLTCVRLLKKLGITSKVQLRQKATSAIEALDSHLQVGDIEILAFGHTEHLIKDLNIVITNVDHVLFKSEDTWRKARHNHKALRRYPAKLQRLAPVQSERWVDFKKWFQQTIEL